jgi:hypothetical protein
VTGAEILKFVAPSSPMSKISARGAMNESVSSVEVRGSEISSGDRHSFSIYAIIRQIEYTTNDVGFHIT